MGLFRIWRSNCSSGGQKKFRKREIIRGNHLVLEEEGEVVPGQLRQRRRAAVDRALEGELLLLLQSVPAETERRGRRRREGPKEAGRAQGGGKGPRGRQGQTRQARVSGCSGHGKLRLLRRLLLLRRRRRWRLLLLLLLLC